MLYTLLIGLQVAAAIAIIVLVLLQHGKGADAGAAFGSGASGTVFGARGSATFLSRATAVLAAVFFINCLGLAYLSAHHGSGSSVLDQPGVQKILDGGNKPSSGAQPAQKSSGSSPSVPSSVPKS